MVMNKQQQDKQIIENAPEGATHWDAKNLYYKTEEDWWYYWSIKLKTWFLCSCNPTIRKLSDIRELVQLRDEVAKYRKAEKALRDLDKYLGIGGDV
jgi:hypothetical protein